MGMPTVKVSYTEAAKTAVVRSDIGIVGLIIKDTVPTINPIVLTSAKEIPTALTEANQLQIKMALKGYKESPKKVVAYVLPIAATDYTDALSFFDTYLIDYLAVPTIATDKKTESVVTWITQARADGQTVQAVLPTTASDNIGIIDFDMTACMAGDVTYTAEQMCARIAGICASVPINESITFIPLPELTGCTKMSRTELDAAIDAGKLVLFWDGEKVKIADGVNSYQKVTEEQGDQFKKIRVVRIMDIIEKDIKTMAEDSYIGRKPNSYTEKLNLVAAIKKYLAEMQADGGIGAFTIDLDSDATKAYLKSKGIDVSAMSDTEIIQANTGDKVFLKATISILDAIENITLAVTV